MRHLRSTFATAIAGAAAAAFLAAGGPAGAQSTVEELTVIGHPMHGKPDTMSYKVTFNDLNLRKESDRKELNRRIDVSARYVCHKLAEPGGTHDEGACRAEAIRDGRKQASHAVHIARTTRSRPHGATWTPPPEA